MNRRRARASRTPGRLAVAAAAGLLAAVLVIPAQPAAAALVTVTDVTVKEFVGKVQIAILATGAVRYRLADWSGKPDTMVVVDILGARLGFSAGELAYRKGDVARVRVGQFNETTVRVVVELSVSRSYTVQTADGNRAVVVAVLSPATGASHPAASAQAGAPMGQTQPVAQAQPAAQATPVPTRRFTLEFRDAKMSDVLAALARLSNLNIVVAPEAADRRVTIRLVGVTLEEALDLLTRPLGLAWARVGRSIVVGPADRIAEQQVEIRYYRLRHARAADVRDRVEALVFGRIRPAQQQQIGPAGQVQVVTTAQVVERTPIVVDERTNTLIVVATREQHQLIAGIIAQLDVQIPVVALSTRVYPLKWLAADINRGESGQPARDPLAEIRTLLTEQLRPSTPQISIDYPNNALIVTATEGDHQRIQQLLAIVDVPIQQLLVEATVVDINLDQLKDLGFDWNVVGQVFTAPYIGATIDFFAALRLLVSDGRGRVLANPRIVTRDGQAAQTFVGDQIPVVTGFDEQGRPIIQTIDAGVKLNITPKINPDGFVTTRILAEVGSLVVVGNAVGKTTRQATSTLTVKDGTPIVIGGLIRNEERHRVVKVPILGDIPIIGWLFRREITERSNREVVFIITPRVLPKLTEPRT
ncbi:MAG: secretin N-terminal domain-containing protein [Armatimonadota bacterium]|nr:secretin N-terminal domain-containing protein [Armatimonadota bacterium]MDR5697249.1 secretin N-terminal domain-containing protein [Armatimonadota bacterium]